MNHRGFISVFASVAAVNCSKSVGVEIRRGGTDLDAILLSRGKMK